MTRRREPYPPIEHSRDARQAFRYHVHPTNDKVGILVGDMSLPPRWHGPGCPPECPLPKPAPVN